MVGHSHNGLHQQIWLTKVFCHEEGARCLVIMLTHCAQAPMAFRFRRTSTRGTINASVYLLNKRQHFTTHPIEYFRFLSIANIIMDTNKHCICNIDLLNHGKINARSILREPDNMCIQISRTPGAGPCLDSLPRQHVVENGAVVIKGWCMARRC